MPTREKTPSKGVKLVSARSSSLGKTLPKKSSSSPDDPQSSTSNTASVRVPRTNGLSTTPKRDSTVRSRISSITTPPTTTSGRATSSITPRGTRLNHRPASLNAPIRPPPTPPIDAVKPSISARNRSVGVSPSNVKASPKVAGNRGVAIPKSTWTLSSARSSMSSVPGKRVSSVPLRSSSTRPSDVTSKLTRAPTNSSTTSNISRVSTTTSKTASSKTTVETLSENIPKSNPLQTTTKSDELTSPKSTSKQFSTKSTAPVGPKVVRRPSTLKPKFRAGSIRRPAPLDLSKAKPANTEKQTNDSPASSYATPMSIPASPPPPTRAPPDPPSGPLVHIDQVLSHLRDNTPSSSPGASARSHMSSQYSPLSRDGETVRTSEDISIRKSPQYRVFLLPGEASAPESRRTSQETVFDQPENRSPSSSPKIPQPESSQTPSPKKLIPTPPIENLSVSQPTPPSPSIYSTRSSGSRRSSYRRSKSPGGKFFDFTSANKITKRRAASHSSISTFSALEISLGTLGAASIRTANSSVRISSESTTPNPSPSPDFLAKETKRLKTRYRIITEIVQTENSFVQDMHVLNECYFAHAHECSILSPKHNQTIFGRLKNVTMFADDFRKELAKASAEYERISEEQINEAQLEELMEWDKDTTMGDAFWSSMVRIEKAYTGYCTHHEEASQMLQELEKAEAVKLWLEECKRRSQDRTKAWDIHSLIIKPVQRVLKYPLLLQELLHNTPTLHADYGSLELATKEIAKVAERINESKKRKEVCDRILAKGRSVNNINTDLAKSYGRRADKLRSSIGLGAGWHDETSELYNDLVTKFAKQAIQVQVLIRDLERWLKDYRIYLGSAESLVAALKMWLHFQRPGLKVPEDIQKSWEAFFSHITNVTTKAFPFLQRTVETKCIQALEKLYDTFKGPAALIAKHNRKAVDFARYNSVKGKEETRDKKLAESAETFQSLHASLLEELPTFISLAGELVEAIIHQFSIAQSGMDVRFPANEAWYQAWMEELAKLVSDPFIVEKSTTEAFVGIVSDFLEHFETQKERFDSMAILNGYALKHASRAPSLAKLAKEEQARFAEGLSGFISPDLTPSPSCTRITSQEFQGYFPVVSPMSIASQRKRFGSIDSNMLSPATPHSCLFRAFSIASFEGKMERVDGFPYLSFSPGQVCPFDYHSDSRNLTLRLRRGRDGWHGYMGLMKLDGYPKVIALKCLCDGKQGVGSLCFKGTC